MRSFLDYLKWRRAAFNKPNHADIQAVLQYVRAAEYELQTGKEASCQTKHSKQYTTPSPRT